MGISRALIVLGAAALFENDVDRAKATFQKSLSICRDLEDAEGIASCSCTSDTQHTCRETKRVRARFGGKPGGVRRPWRLARRRRGAPRTGKSSARAGERDARAATLCRESLAFSSKLDNKSHIAFCLTVLAGVIQVTGDAVRAALFGVAETLLESLDAVLDPAGTLEYEDNLAATRAQMSQHAFAKAWREGKKMTHEQTITEAMKQFVRISTSAAQHFSRSAWHACRASKSRLAKA